MIGYGLDRGGPKDSETAPNSFLTKINGKGFWRFATDMNSLLLSNNWSVKKIAELFAIHHLNSSN